MGAPQASPEGLGVVVSHPDLSLAPIQSQVMTSLKATLIASHLGCLFIQPWAYCSVLHKGIFSNSGLGLSCL